MVFPFLIIIIVLSVALSTKVKFTENEMIIETGVGMWLPYRRTKSRAKISYASRRLGGVCG
jgi:hypothetical protein